MLCGVYSSLLLISQRSRSHSMISSKVHWPRMRERMLAPIWMTQVRVELWENLTKCAKFRYVGFFSVQVMDKALEVWGLKYDSPNVSMGRILNL